MSRKTKLRKEELDEALQHALMGLADEIGVGLALALPTLLRQSAADPVVWNAFATETAALLEERFRGVGMSWHTASFIGGLMRGLKDGRLE